MFYRFIKSRFVAVLLFVSFIFLVGYARHKQDPFSAYRDLVKKPLLIKEKKLNHYAEEEALIREKLKLSLSDKEYSILSGIHWILGLADDDKNFKFLFPDFMLLIDALSNS